MASRRKTKAVRGRPAAGREVRPSEAVAHQQVQALLAGVRSVLVHQEFAGAARAIFEQCKQTLGATAGYVALLNAHGDENEVLFLDPGQERCTVDPSLPMPIRGLRERAYLLRRAVYDNDFAGSRWQRFLPSGHAPLHNVLFAPLVLDEVAVGLLGLANKPNDFNDQDAELAEVFGQLAAIALRNSRTLELLARREAERDRSITELEEALGRVSTLSGLIPICCYCKQVRDDLGYWHAVEQYVHDQTGAQFTHGLCPTCARRLAEEIDDPPVTKR